MWPIYLIFFSMLGARESLSEKSLKKRQIYYPQLPNFYGYPGQQNYPQVLVPPGYYQPNEYAYRMFWITPEPAHAGTTKLFVSSRDNFDTTDDQTSGSARKSSNPVIVENKERKNDIGLARKSAGDEKLNTNVTIEAKLDGRSNDTLATGARLEVEISSDNSTDTRIENKNSTAS